MEKHLKSYQEYADLYDHFTVKECRGIDSSFESSKDEDTDEDAKKAAIIARRMYLHFTTGERYVNREKKIREWMERDQKKDDLYESAQAPEDMRCLTCRNRLKPSSKLFWSDTGKEDRILFIYDCPNQCVPRRMFFSDGEEMRMKPNLCPKCDTPLDVKHEDDKIKLVTTSTCPKCEYSTTDELVWSTKDKENDFDEHFARDRDRFCLTREDGENYIDGKRRMEELGKLMDEFNKEQEVRKEKLKEFPQGFHVEGAGYTCPICHDHTPEGDNWYDENGVKCLVCQKAIDEGEIPGSLAKDTESWYTRFDMEHYFNVKSQTLRKWIREGIIKARTVSHYGKGEHTVLFLIEDNKDFLPPKKMVESRGVTTQKDGETWYHSEKWYRFVDPFEHLKGYKIMDHMRVVPEEEMKERERIEKEKREAKLAKKKSRK